MSVAWTAWAGTLAVVLVMLAVDLFAHRREHVIRPREAAWWSAVWIAIGLAFGGAVAWAYGAQRGVEYWTGYLVEKALSVDNVVVFALILTSFGVPRALQHRVLFYGVIGALVLRAVFIAVGAALLARFHWILYVFGAFLVLTGWKMFRHRHELPDPTRSRVLRWVRRVLPTTDTWRGNRFFVREAGRFVATPLFVVLLLVEATDVLFAVDSIPAIFAVTEQPFIVFSSNAFAILGLRALYFLLADLVDRLVHLKAGLSAVLVFVGAKMLLADVWKVPVGVSLAVIAALIGGSVATSLRATRAEARRATIDPTPSS